MPLSVGRGQRLTVAEPLNPLFEMHPLSVDDRHHTLAIAVIQRVGRGPA